eukprot:scaffold14396_cov73-Cylindrotheca_fusiformis.AAC.2
MVKVMREFLQHGLKRNWAPPMHQRVLREESMSFLQFALMVPSSGRPGQVLGPCDHRPHVNKFRRYSSLAEAQDDLRDNRCLSLVMYHSPLNPRIHHMGVIVAEKGHGWTYWQIEPHLEDPRCYNDPLGFSYYPSSFRSEALEPPPVMEIRECNRPTMTLTSNDVEVEDSSFLRAVIGLPLLHQNPENQGAGGGAPLYAFLDGEGLSLSEQGTFR